MMPELLQGALSVFLLTLGLGQILSTRLGLRAASLVGPGRAVGYGAGALLAAVGALGLPQSWAVLWWALPAGPLALVTLLLAGSFIAPPPHPDRLFEADDLGHGNSRAVEIPDGDDRMPGLLLTPALAAGQTPTGMAVCIVPGAGNTKTGFKWRLVRALLAEGLTVLLIDTPGHGQYRRRPLAYPDCLSAAPAALRFLRRQPGIDRVGLIGISLGGALALRSLVEQPEAQALVQALAVLETPVGLRYHRGLYYRELWQTLSRAPILSLFKEISLKQIRQSWQEGGLVSRHRTDDLINLLDPPGSLARLADTPVLLGYSRGDPIAPPAAARAMQAAAPRATLLESKKASHVTLTLIPEFNRQVARWLKAQLGEPTGRRVDETITTA